MTNPYTFYGILFIVLIRNKDFQDAPLPSAISTIEDETALSFLIFPVLGSQQHSGPHAHTLAAVRFVVEAILVTLSERRMRMKASSSEFRE